MSVAPSDSSSIYNAVAKVTLALLNLNLPVPGSAFVVDVSNV